jgi:hypothetical protein
MYGMVDFVFREKRCVCVDLKGVTIIDKMSAIEIDEWVGSTYRNDVLLTLCAPFTLHLRRKDTPYVNYFHLNFVRMLTSYLEPTRVLIICSAHLGAHSYITNECFRDKTFTWRGTVDHELFPELHPRPEVYHMLTRGNVVTEICTVVPDEKTKKRVDGTFFTCFHSAKEVRARLRHSNRVLCVDL